ncbi:hypothetical protein [Muricoccus vinaceus]|uniref:Gluconate 2-dehydrogenase flavoprotein n=1 Tax=Muricoccus vinaceus TaxID=424704 RepID=A0ABV6INS1_9PROT
MPKTDVVIVGMGWTGSICARERAAEGLRVGGLERGGFRDTASDFPAPNALDELNYSLRGALFQNLARDALTFRNHPDEPALPMRSLGAFLLGDVLGGRSLERAALPLPACRLRDAQPQHQAPRRGRHHR